MMRPVSFILLVIAAFFSFSQSSISKDDIEVHTQLTFLTVYPEDLDVFKDCLSELSSIAKEIKLDSKYDWLIYTYSPTQFLVITFSDGLNDILTFEDYVRILSKSSKSKEVLNISKKLKSLRIIPEKNLIQQMLLPWSTVDGISTSEFPLTTLVEYKIPVSELDNIDTEMRKIAKLLKDIDYPYPLEGNRGSLGSYGNVYQIWFYDDSELFSNEKSPSLWMKKSKQATERFEKAMENIRLAAVKTDTYELIYQNDLSY